MDDLMAEENPINKAATKGRGRPRGAQHDVTFSVRLPRATLKALKELARLEKCKVSQAIRAGIVAKIVEVLPRLVATANNEKRAASRRLKAIQRLRLLLRADLHLSPVGLQLARARAKGLLHDPLRRIGAPSRGTADKSTADNTFKPRVSEESV